VTDPIMSNRDALTFLARRIASFRNFNPFLVSVIVLLHILRHPEPDEQRQMAATTDERIAELRAHVTPVLPDDPMSEAARKALLKDFIRMLDNESGSRTGADMMHVHQMRVATRRMRSVFQLLGGHFKSKAVSGYQRRLRQIARALGQVRDLDVTIANLTRFQETLGDTDRTALQKPIDILSQRRDSERKKLDKALDKKGYHKFVDDFTAFVTTPGEGAQSLPQGDGVPTEVRHLLPVAAYEHLAAVRAYGRSLADAENETLHLLRIEFKRLRYLLSIFDDVLGKAGKDFIGEIKIVQDHLGRLQDAVVAEAHFRGLAPQLDDTERAAVDLYLASLASEYADLRATFPDVWKRFNTRTVQRQLGSAISGL
jgi:CHAD domain-containing protein